jgi:general stress protein YciG
MQLHADPEEIVITGQGKERRGFASMSAEKQREIASKGGRAAHEKGTAHEWSADEARNAGRKGGQVSRGGRGRLPSTDGIPAPGASGTETMASGAGLAGYRSE